jgi:2-polyprenyl-3-methyl-5-hydroxy-6-metoxy-1,4-benzoquinol methylase
LAERRIIAFWENQAGYIHERWGAGDWDVPVLDRIIQTYRPGSILDIGCGSGRLFGLYLQHGISNILGVDISEEALRLARERYPNVVTRLGRLEDTVRPTEAFDLMISNRVLQHVPTRSIAQVVQQLCSVGRLIYINELSASDNESEEFSMVRHDYERLFAANGWNVLERGTMEDQTYLLIQAPTRSDPSVAPTQAHGE